MAIRNYKPTTPGRRKMSALVNEEITTNVPEKSLTVTIKKNGGNITGSILLFLLFNHRIKATDCIALKTCHRAAFV